MIGNYEAHERMTPANATLPQRNFGMRLCNKVATVLKEGGVENILWGSHLMATYTVPALLQVMFFLSIKMHESGLPFGLPGHIPRIRP